MPYNLDVYPNQYAVLSQATEAVDPYAELLRQILTLRHQHLLKERQAAISIAELQNQVIRPDITTLTAVATAPTIVNNITNISQYITTIQQVINAPTSYSPPSPPPAPGTTDPPPSPPATPPPVPAPAPPVSSVGKAILGGGEETGVHRQVEKFTYATERVAALAFDLGIPRMRHAGASSLDRGFWYGGTTGLDPNGARTATAEAVNFATERKLSFSSTLTTARAHARTGYDNAKAYIACNYAPNQASFDIHNFFTDAITAGSGTLANITGSCNSTQSPTKTYLAGGRNDVRNISTIAFSTNALGTIAALLSIARSRGAGFQSTTEGFIAGGYSFGAAAYRDTTDRLLFSNETIALETARLSVADVDMEAGSTFGSAYVFGGYFYKPRIREWRFALRAWKNVGFYLGRGGRDLAAVGRP